MPTINQLIRKPRVANHGKEQGAGLGWVPAKARCVYACLYHDPEEADSALRKVAKVPLDERLRGDQLHRR